MRAETDAVFEIPLSDAPDAARLSLTRAQCPATASAMVVDHQGRSRVVEVPGENALTVYLDKQEIVTLMTLGQAPEALIMGYLRNQRLVESLADLLSVHVDWDVGACAVHTRQGRGSELAARTATRMAKRTVTTGCGQGTMFGDWLDELQPLHSDDLANPLQLLAPCSSSPPP